MRVHAIGFLARFALLGSILAGCGPGGQTPAASGFLAHRSQLRPGRADQAQLIYINPEADFSSYENVIIDPVVVWQAAGSGFSGVSPEELETLALELGSSMREQLAHAFQVVDRSAAGTLRLRIALVELRRSSASDGSDLVERVALEVEVLDAVSGQRLVAVADARGGGEGLPPADRERTDVRAVFHEWARRARDRLATFRDFDAAQ